MTVSKLQRGDLSCDIFQPFSFATMLCLMAMTAASTAGELSGDRITTANGDLVVHPVNHATFVMQWNGKTVYADPVGGGKPFADLPKPDLVLVTHHHFDHFDPKTLEAALPGGGQAIIVATRTVAEKMPEALRGMVRILTNGEKTEAIGIQIEAVPTHNSPRQGEVPSQGTGQRIRVDAGRQEGLCRRDTEDTPEMRALRGIDVAFLPMNLPCTMSAEKAAEAIRKFKPKVVYPYHFRGGDGTKANLGQLKRLVGDGVEIRVREWYAEG